MVLGDLGNKYMVKLLNGGTSVNANMVHYDTNFPNSQKPVNMNLFPAAFYLDLNNDGIKDLLVSPNTRNASENFNSIWYYKNTNKNDSANFVFVQENFLQDGMIDVGEGAYPVFFDYNNDGLPDLFVGNHGYFSPQGYQSSLALFKNTGTKASPSFELVTRDYGNFSSLDLRTMYPTFGDLDGDGDSDLIIGDNLGNLAYFENTAGAGNLPNYVLKSSNYFSLRAGNNATPQLFDVNKDGLLDLVVGTQNGILAYFPNKGSASSPQFNQTDMVRPFGGVDVSSNSSTGHSVPHFYLDKADNKIKLLVGSESGRLHFYENIEENLSGNFKLVNPHVGLLAEGRRTSPFITFDLTDDLEPVMVVGNYAGGLSYYEKAINLSVNKPLAEHPVLKIFPVPAKDYLTIEPAAEITGSFSISIYNQMGIKVFENHYVRSEAVNVDTQSFSEGIYFIHLNANGKSSMGKAIINR